MRAVTFGRIMFSVKTFFLYVCATRSEIPSNINTMYYGDFFYTFLISVYENVEKSISCRFLFLIFLTNIFNGQEVPRNAANARERTRMRVLSKAFGRLKLTLPWVPPDTKVGKVLN